MFIMIMSISFGAFSMTSEEYLSTTQAYIKSCNTLKAIVEDKAGRGDRYSKLILEELIVRSSYYFSKYNPSEMKDQDFKLLSTKALDVCISSVTNGNPYLNVDKAFNDAASQLFKK